MLLNQAPPLRYEYVGGLLPGLISLFPSFFRCFVLSLYLPLLSSPSFFAFCSDAPQSSELMRHMRGRTSTRQDGLSVSSRFLSHYCIVYVPFIPRVLLGFF